MNRQCQGLTDTVSDDFVVTSVMRFADSADYERLLAGRATLYGGAQIIYSGARFTAHYRRIISPRQPKAYC